METNWIKLLKIRTIFVHDCATYEYVGSFNCEWDESNDPVYYLARKVVSYKGSFAERDEGLVHFDGETDVTVLPDEVAALYKR